MGKSEVGAKASSSSSSEHGKSSSSPDRLAGAVGLLLQPGLPPARRGLMETALGWTPCKRRISLGDAMQHAYPL